jgi:hypothetical protein
LDKFIYSHLRVRRGQARGSIGLKSDTPPGPTEHLPASH